MCCVVRAVLLMAMGSFLATAVRADDVRRPVEPGDDLAKLAAEAPPGTVFVLAPGHYAAANIVPKDRQTFEGNGRAVISGAVTVADFRNDGSLWRAQGPAPLALSHGGCDPKRWTAPADGCLYRESLYADGRLIRRVFALADVKGDTWFQSRPDGEVVIGFDPAHRAVEISHAETAFMGAATGVVLRGLTIEKFTPIAQHGAVQADKSAGWTIENSVIRDNSGAGVRTGNAMRLIANRVVDNGQIGITGSGNDIVVNGNEIAFNNSHGFSSAWEAGGTKFVATNNLLAERNCVHHNVGPGLWTDIDNRTSTFTDNVIAYNEGVGIFHEISGAAMIVGNLSVANGSQEDSPWASQILVSGSIDTEVRGNRVVVARDYGHGIFVVEEGRPNDSKVVDSGPTYASRGNSITGNEIRFLGDHGIYGFHAQGPLEPSLLRTRNRFAANTIIAGDDRPRFADDGPRVDLKTEMTRGQEIGSRLLIVTGVELAGGSLSPPPGCKFD